MTRHELGGFLIVLAALVLVGLVYSFAGPTAGFLAILAVAAALYGLGTLGKA